MLAVVLGLAGGAIFAAVSNHDVYYRLPKAHLIEDLGGRNAARVAYLILGLICLGLAAAIVWLRR